MTEKRVVTMAIISIVEMERGKQFGD